MSAAATPALPAAPAVAAIPPRTGEVHDAGAVRRDSVRAQRWTATGAAKILGDVEVDAAELSGLISVRGALLGGTVRSAGTLDIVGAVRLTGALSSTGTTHVGTSLDVSDLEIDGALSVGGPLRATGLVHWKGSVETPGPVNAARVVFQGRCAIDGALVATEVEGRLRGPSTIGSIRADRVLITRPARLFGGGALEVLTIEAKEVDLAHVRAQYVRAERIALGPGCQIAQVEGTITRRHATAFVGPASRSPAPYGLSR